MLRQSLMSILILMSISIGNADEGNNLFILDYQQTQQAAPAPYKAQQELRQQTPVVKAADVAPPVVTPPPVAPPKKAPVVRSNVDEGNSQFIQYNYWDLGTEEHLVDDAPSEESSEVVSSEVKTPEVINVRPKPRPTPPPKVEIPKPTPAPRTPAKPAPASPKAPAKPAGGLRCEKPKGIAAACSQNGIREGLEKVLSDCGTVRCYLRLFHMETSCRPYLTHQAIVTAYGMCSIEKDRNLRKRFGDDCSKIDTVDSQIRCCRKMMKTVGTKYFEPVKRGRLAKCE